VFLALLFIQLRGTEPFDESAIAFATYAAVEQSDIDLE